MTTVPYPGEFVSRETIPGVGECLLRPVRPEDELTFLDSFSQLSLHDVHMRFFTPLRSLPPQVLARLTHIDYDHEMAFVLFDSANLVAGISRMTGKSDSCRAEFAIVTRSDLKRHGIALLLMNKLIAYARTKGVTELFGDVLAENAAMLAFCRTLGCSLERSPEDHFLVRATLQL